MIKTCGITRVQDARLCAEAGADLLGFIFHPSSPRCVEPTLPAGLSGHDLGQARKVGVFVTQTAQEVRQVMDRACLDYAQLHGDQGPDFCRAVGLARVIKVFWPQRHATLASLQAHMARFADCALFLLDAGTWGGGHGKSLDFALLAGLKSPRPWLLAGGLGPDSLGAALATCAPIRNMAGVDLNSGVESTPGIKEPHKIRSAMAVCRRSNP